MPDRFTGARSAGRAFAVGSLVLATAACVAHSSTPPAQREGSRAPAAAPPIGHVWTIMLENKSYEATFSGLNRNDYLWKTLPSYGELLAMYFGTGHDSLDNYISAVSGQSPAPDDQQDCPRYQDVTPGTPAPDGQTHASHGCVYPARVRTLFNQLDAVHKTWKVYEQDMGDDPGRERVYDCGIPGNPHGRGVPDPAGAIAGDQYVPKHNPAAWFHAVIDSRSDCANVVPLDGYPARKGHDAITSLAHDLRSESTTPAFSWITPNSCSDAHDAVCRGNNLSHGPNRHQGGLYAADIFLEKYIPMIMRSPAYQDDGLIEIVFDEAFPPYRMYGNSFADLAYRPDDVLGKDRATGRSVAAEANTAQSVVACCNELPGPNTDQPGNRAFNQDTTPGGGITGAVFLSRYITPGSVTEQPYNHYSWLRSTEDMFGIRSGGTDGRGHLGYAAMPGLRTFGSDVFNNPRGYALRPSPSGSSIYAATANPADPVHPRVVHPPRRVGGGGH